MWERAGFEGCPHHGERLVRAPIGSVHERRDQSDGHDEQEDELATNTKDHDGVREAKRDDE